MPIKVKDFDKKEKVEVKKQKVLTDKSKSILRSVKTLIDSQIFLKSKIQGFYDYSLLSSVKSLILQLDKLSNENLTNEEISTILLNTMQISIEIRINANNKLKSLRRDKR